MRYILPSFILLFTFLSCTDVDDRVVPVLGVYRGHIVGLTGPFDIVVAANGADNISIDAPFDGDNYMVVNADMDQLDEWVIDIDVNRQSIGDLLEISGDGFADGETIQIDYTLIDEGERVSLKMIGSKVR